MTEALVTSGVQQVGVFDSGVGGLSVLRAIRRELPAEHVLYVADSAHAPYGNRTAEFIEARALAAFDVFDRRGVKAAVVACNTATAAAVSTLRARFAFPIVAIEPAVKPAAALTRTGVVGVLATPRTLSSTRFLQLVDAHGQGVQVLVQPCPGWVEIVERADLSSEASLELVARHLTPVLARGADTLVLGCTHYPFLRPLIERVAGAGVTVIDPADAVARELRRRLEKAGSLAPLGRAGGEQFLTTGDAAQVGAVIRQLWSSDAAVQHLGLDLIPTSPPTV